jgi:hypothetical protein
MPKLKSIKITDVRVAVAKECLTYNDTSKENITKITKAYLSQLKKDGCKIQHWEKKNPPTQTVNATKVQLEIQKLKKEWHI